MDAIERPEQPGIARGAVGRGVDAPAEGAEVGGVRGEEPGDGSGHRRNDQQRRSRSRGGRRGLGRRRIGHERVLILRIGADAALAAIALPFAIETVQFAVTPLVRACQSADVVDNLTGLLVGSGTIVAWLVSALRRRERSA